MSITPQWSEQALTLALDPEQWLCLGTCGQNAMSRKYGEAPIDEVLRDVNVDLMLVFFPLRVEPDAPLDRDLGPLRAGRDYPVRLDLLPSGFVQLDTIRIHYPH